MMDIAFYQVDAFADGVFKGNPAGVFLPDAPLADRFLWEIAREFPHLESAFLFGGPGGYQLRWFSPKMEMPLCGHATLATAHVLWETGRAVKGEALRFETMSGGLTVREEDGWIEMDLPMRSSEVRALPVELEELFGGKYVNALYSVDRYIVELASASEVRNFVPDVRLLRDHRCVITARGELGGAYDFVSRYFAIPVGFVEDHVTGTAHCSLAPYWARQLGKDELFAYQASARGGEVRVRLSGDRVFLAGQAVTVLEGRVRI